MPGRIAGITRDFYIHQRRRKSMRQGRASRDGRYGGKVEPKPNVYLPGGVGQIGVIQGSHLTSGPDSDYRGDPLRGGRGFKAHQSNLNPQTEAHKGDTNAAE